MDENDFTTDETANTPANDKIKFGDIVEYVDGKGHIKLAIVTATKKTVAEGSSVSPLSKGFVGITVFSLSGSSYARYGVPSEKAALKDGGYGEKGELRRYVRPISA